MRNACLTFILFVLSAAVGSFAAAQDEHNYTASDSGIQMIARSTQAVDYRRGDHSYVDMTGTNLMPDVTGKAKIINKRGVSDIHVDVENLRPANALDAAYLTYVLWAISPEGVPQNIGELVEKGGRASLHTTASLQAFALVITAEPDFAVSQPSEFVVAENSLRVDTKGTIEPIQVHYQVFPRSVYISSVAPASADIYRDSKNAPLDLLEARNAVHIAQASHADEYASDALNRAQDLLREAEDDFNSHHSEKTIATAARMAVQTAEEARTLAVRQEHQARLERERREAQERAQKASQQAQSEAEQRQRIEQQNQAAQQEAEQQRQQAEQAQQQAQQEAQQRAAAEQQAQQTAQQVDEARQRAQEAQQRAQQAETQQQQLRQQVRDQLNQILETRDTARGLIVSMPDVLFDAGSASLK